jgi:hypothetical protein
MVSRISLSTLVFTFALVTAVTWARPNYEDLDERGKGFTVDISILHFLPQCS